MVRFKSRYLLCEIVVDDPLCRQNINQGLVQSAIKDALIRAHGDFGFACCSVSFAGTIRTCQKYLIQYNQKQLLRLLYKSTSDVERKQIESSIRSCSLEAVEDEEDSQSSCEDEPEP
uniref:Ribonuclease P/MRP protein subunit POP5 n=1 Tax=Geotrypetes seraphini TaxID=260995 RepID=A0A6P8S3T3_GEOSA|nr:ribonuclease P/MRP protein subunit POP5 isoform X2 [Geotrypetes seraphini]